MCVNCTKLIDAMTHESVILTQQDAKMAFLAPVRGAATSSRGVLPAPNLFDAMSRVTDPSVSTGAVGREVLGRWSERYQSHKPNDAYGLSGARRYPDRGPIGLPDRPQSAQGRRYGRARAAFFFESI